MKKIIKKVFATAFVSLVACISFLCNPVTAYAEESTQPPKINENSSLETPEEIPETEKKDEITVDLSNLTYEQFLEVVDILAAQTGNADIWKETINSVKKAIDEKQFTASNILLIITSGVMVIKIFYDWAIKKKEKDHISQTGDTRKEIKNQSKAINSLIDEEEKIEKSVEENGKMEKAIALAGVEQNAALRCFVRGIQVHETAREEALRHLNNSDELYETVKRGKINDI